VAKSRLRFTYAGKTWQKTPLSSRNVVVSSKTVVYVALAPYCTDTDDSQNKVGILAKETPTGPFATEWQAAYADIKSEIEEVDVTNAFSAAAMSVKDENELVSWQFECPCQPLLTKLPAHYSRCFPCF
jgi:hypothetical protein